jgi:hypothetical protein
MILKLWMDSNKFLYDLKYFETFILFLLIQFTGFSFFLKRVKGKLDSF